MQVTYQRLHDITPWQLGFSAHIFGISRQEYDAVLLAVGSTVARDMQTAAWRNPEKQTCLGLVSAKLMMISFLVMLLLSLAFFSQQQLAPLLSNCLWNQVHG